MDNTNNSEDNWEADNESDIKLDNGSEHSETPQAAECERHTECSWIDSAYTTVKEEGWEAIDDRQYNVNEKE